MAEILKLFGKGLLYTLLSPFILLIILLYMIYGLFHFIFLAIKSLVLFFKGKDLNSETAADVKAKQILYNIKPEPAEDEIEILDEKEEEVNNLTYNSSFLYSNFDLGTGNNTVSQEENNEPSELADIKTIENVIEEEETPIISEEPEIESEEIIEEVGFIPLEEPEIEEEEEENTSEVEEENVEEEIPFIPNETQVEEEIIEDEKENSSNGVTFLDFDDEEEW